MQLELHATPGEVMRAVETLHQFAQNQGVSEKTLHSLALALEECASNVVNHSLKGDPNKVFSVQFECERHAFHIEITDDGPEFDPTQSAPRIQQQEDDLPGGWGIELVRRRMDAMLYRREEGKNVLRLTKNLPGDRTEK